MTDTLADTMFKHAAAIQTLVAQDAKGMLTRRDFRQEVLDVTSDMLGDLKDHGQPVVTIGGRDDE